MVPVRGSLPGRLGIIWNLSDEPEGIMKRRGLDSSYAEDKAEAPQGDVPCKT